MVEPKKYQTIAAPTEAEFRDRGSRFLAFAFPIQSIEAAKAQLKFLKGQHLKANHHCVAYRLGFDQSVFRASDDGEPSGSAGRPILAAIDSMGLTQVMVVVVRYFGGTLLGVPGLIQAYNTVSRIALDAAIVEAYWVTTTIKIDCGYDALGAVLHLMKTNEATILHQDMQLFCSLRVAVPAHLVPFCLSQLQEIRGVEAGLLEE
ncbi:MAG: YigZ family protein [Bacteroidetes bacterium]|nr:YigZ family protein [Bacteroidota bacterium]